MTLEERIIKLEEKMSWLIRVSEKNLWYTEKEARQIQFGMVKKE